MPDANEENKVAKVIVDCAFQIHRDLGSGLLESCYSTIFAHLLKKRGLAFEMEKPIPVSYEGLRLETGFRLDFLVENLVIVELKFIEDILPVHKKQVLTYLKLAKRRLDLLINFNVPLIRDGIRRIAHKLPEMRSPLENA